AAAAATTAAESATGIGARSIVAAVRIHAAVDAAREADVGIGASGGLRRAERDVRKALEGGRQRIAFGRLRDQVADQIGGCDHQSGGAGVFEKVSARRAHLGSKARKFTTKA